VYELAFRNSTVVKDTQIKLFEYYAHVLKVGNNICLSPICIVFLRGTYTGTGLYRFTFISNSAMWTVSQW